ncbi:MAG: hypothetical protein CR994_01550 [Maribacter sp.]|nr:MAG: hypothetical protein CR994_01550 [Maribacter sp.]
MGNHYWGRGHGPKDLNLVFNMVDGHVHFLEGIPYITTCSLNMSFVLNGDINKKGHCQYSQ